MKIKFNIMIIFFMLFFSLTSINIDAKYVLSKESMISDMNTIVENHSWSRKLNSINPNYDPNRKICNKCKKVVYEII